MAIYMQIELLNIFLKLNKKYFWKFNALKLYDLRILMKLSGCAEVALVAVVLKVKTDWMQPCLDEVFLNNLP